MVMATSEQLELPVSFKTSARASFLKSCFNGLNALSGIGIITIPYALSRGGWLSILLLLSVAIITFCTALLLQRCLDSSPSIRSFSDIGEHAFGHKGRMLISVLIYVESYLVAIGFLIMESDNLNKLFPNVGLTIGGHEIRGKPLFTLLAGLVILPSMWLRDLSKLGFVSAGGLASTAITMGCIFWVGAVDGVGFSGNGGELFQVEGIPSALSLFVFSYGAHAVFPTIYSSMQDKNQFSKLMSVCFGFSTLCYATMAVIGYLMFGQFTQSQITLNLPTDKIASKIAIYTTLANPISKYALYLSPIPIAIENNLPTHWNVRPVYMLMRTLLLITTVIIALAFPYFGELAELIGAVLVVTSSILLPCACYLKIFRRYKEVSIELVSIVTIMIMASAIGLMGSYTSLKQIIRNVL